MRLKGSRKIQNKESKLILQGILVMTLFLFYKLKSFEDPNDDSIRGKEGKHPWERIPKGSRKILNKESKLILHRILVMTLFLFYKFKSFKYPKDDSI
jgi:hypothetical protein